MRQLLAILFTDIVGYSRQMDMDESGTMLRLEEHNRLLDAAVARYEGRVIKTVGDAYLVVFQSSVAAVDCALDAQRAFELHNSIVEEGERIQVRMGVHQGDVLVREDGDLFGEAVNIAARLEPLAPPGAVCVSHAVMEQVRHKVRAQVTPLGEVALKNISGLVRIYVLRPGADLVEAGQTGPRKVVPARRRWLWVAGGVLAAALASCLLLLKRQPGGLIHRGGELHLAVGYDATDQWDVYASEFNRNYLALQLVLESLCQVTPGGEIDPSRSVLEEVASETADKRLRLKLRPGVFFHDHPCFPGGTGPMARAGDVVFSLEEAARTGHLALPVAGMQDFVDRKAATIAGITTSGEWGVNIDMSTPAPFFRAALHSVTLLPRAVGACPVQRPIGTGPFRFAPKVETGDQFTLLAAPRYWRHLNGERLPYLDAVVLGGADAPAATLTQLEAKDGSVDLFMPKERDWLTIFNFGDPPALTSRYESLRSVSVATEVSRNEISLYELECVARPGGPLGDARVRKAVALAVDREALAKTRPDLVDRPATRFIRPPVFGSDTGVPELRIDLAEAKRLLAEAGHPDGTGIPELVVISQSSGPINQELAAQLGRIGLRLRFQPAMTLDAGRGKEGTTDLVVEETTETLVGGEEPEMGSTFDSPVIRALRLKLASTSSRSERGQIYNQIERAMLDDLTHIPIAWMSTRLPYNAYALRKTVRGFSDPATQFAEFTNLPQTWLEPR